MRRKYIALEDKKVDGRSWKGTVNVLCRVFVCSVSVWPEKKFFLGVVVRLLLTFQRAAGQTGGEQGGLSLWEQVLLRQWAQEIISREGRGHPIIFWAVSMTLCRALLSVAKLLAYHTGMQYMSTLSIAEEQLRLHVDWPGELLWDARSQEFKGWHMLFLLKSMIISLVFPIPRSRLFAEHHSDTCPTLSLSSASSPLEMTLTAVVSSANFMIRVGGWESGRGYSHVCKVNTEVDSAHSRGETQCWVWEWKKDRGQVSQIVGCWRGNPLFTGGVNPGVYWSGCQGRYCESKEGQSWMRDNESFSDYKALL